METIKKIKQMIAEGVLRHEDAVKYFPELKESEDEKIKKVLIRFFLNYKEQEECGVKTFYGIPTNNILAWLEKLGKQKPAEWSEEDEKMLDTVIEDIIRLAGPYVCYHKDVDWLKSLKGRVQPQIKQEWSEEDEEIRKSIIDIIERRRMSSIGSESAICENQIDFLKSLSPKKQWKPSKEQLTALSILLKCGKSDDMEALVSLYEQLKDK